MIEDEIRALLEAKAEALVRRDAVAMAALLDPGFVYLNAGGRVLDKAAFIETYCVSGQVAFLSQQVTRLAIVPQDGFAIATLALRDVFRVQDRVIKGDYRSLCVFRTAGGSWQWVAGQTAPAPAG